MQPVTNLRNGESPLMAVDRTIVFRFLSAILSTENSNSALLSLLNQRPVRHADLQVSYKDFLEAPTQQTQLPCATALEIVSTWSEIRFYRNWFFH